MKEELRKIIEQFIEETEYKRNKGIIPGWGTTRQPTFLDFIQWLEY